jgi:transcriptional regulator with XRE-family HTH domain
MREYHEYEEDEKSDIMTPAEQERFIQEYTEEFDRTHQIERKVDPNEVFRLYYKSEWTQETIAKKFGVTKATISNIFQFHGWEARHLSRKRPVEQDDEIFRLYHEENMSQYEIARKLGISQSTVSRSFRLRGVKTRQPKRRADVDIEELKQLYYQEERTINEIAERYGLSSKSISRLFKDHDLDIIDRRKYHTKKQRVKARQEIREKHYHKVNRLREDLFGTNCRICGVEKSRRNTLAIHRKDGTPHAEDALRRIGFLKTLNPDDWAALCIRCHRGVTWLMETFDIKWDYIQDRLGTEKQPDLPLFSLPSDQDPISADYIELKNCFNGTIQDLLRALFGETCYFCGEHYHQKEKNLPTHRKDGRPHHKKLLRYERYVKHLNPDEWVTLCTKEHNYVHWAMDRLGMTWNDFERLNR